MGTQILRVCIVTVLLLVGCRTAPIYDVIKAPVVTADNKYTLTDMQRAIFRAATSLGWQPQKTGERRIIATLHQRDAIAQVAIDYTWRDYSIRYQDSSNLDYDGSNIRGGYNRWIRNLDKRIKVELSGL